MKLRQRMLPFLTLSVVTANLFICLLAGYALYESRSSYEKGAEIETQNLATTLDYVLTEKFRKLDFALLSAAREYERQLTAGGIQPDTMSAYLKMSQESLPELDGLRITDDQGVITYNRNQPGPDKVSLADRDYFLHHRNQATATNFLGVTVKSRVTGNWIAPLARRLNSLDGHFNGIVYATIRVDELVKAFADIQVDQKGTVLVRDEDFRLVTRYPPIAGEAGAIGSNKASTELRTLVEAGAQSNSFFAPHPPDGVARRYSFRHLPDIPWFVMVGKAQEEYLAEWYQQLLRYLGFILLFAGASLVAARLIRSNWLAQEAVLTERKNAERSLTQAMEAAQAASRAKSRFLAVMGHELRTPMNGIQGMAQMLMLEDIDAAERVDFAQTIHHSGALLLSLLNNILDYAQIESGQLALERSPFSPAQLLDQVANKISAPCAAKGLELRKSCTVAEEKIFWGDPGRLRQIFGNLADNAAKFTDTGWVDLCLSEVAGETADKTTLRFTVTDSGIGIPDDKQTSLFEAFVQIDDSSTRRHEGAGLGLAICMKLVRLMQGRMGIKSQVGKGSTFWVEIPAEATTVNEDQL